MRLRSTTRLPERYLDGGQPEVRRRASFVERSSNFNPDLPPAAFPTLEYPPTVEPQALGAASNSVLNLTKSQDNAIQLQLRPKKATVFHAKKDSTGQFIQGSLLASAKFGRFGVVEVESRRLTAGNSSSDHTDTVEYDGWQAMANSDDTPRVGLSAYELVLGWSQVSDDMKLVLFKEIMATHSFNEAAEKLMLTNAQRENIMALFRREIAREARGNARIEHVQAAQLRMLMSVNTKISRGAVSGSFEDLYANIEEPAASRVSKSDIACAQRFLRSINLDGYVSRLWRYEGVALDLVDWHILFTEETPDTVKTASAENQHHYHPTSGGADKSLGISARRKRKTLFENVGGPASIKRKRRMTQVGRIGVPSPLRTCVLHNSEEKVVAGIATTMASLVSESQPAKLTSLQSQVEKQHTAQSIRLVMKSTPKPQSPKTPARQTSNMTENFTNSLSPTQPKQPSSLEQSKISQPILRPDETLPQMQKTQPNSPQKDLGQAKSFIQENIKGVDKALISENERSARTLPLMKVSSMIGGRSAENLGKDENNKYIENAEHILADSVSARNGHNDQEFATQVEDNALPIQHRRKKRKTDDDAPWRASGQRKSKFPVRVEPPARRKRTSTEETQVQETMIDKVKD